MQALIEEKGWEFLRLRIVSLSRRSGSKWWSRSLLAGSCLLKNLAISMLILCLQQYLESNQISISEVLKVCSQRLAVGSYTCAGNSMSKLLTTIKTQLHRGHIRKVPLIFSLQLLQI